jgi:hypothetical protein
MAHNRLSTRTVEAKLKRGRYGDGGGLFLQVSKWGTKSWVFRFERAGVERHMGLGPLHTLSLAEARERARECRRVLLDGRDPIEARDTSARRGGPQGDIQGLRGTISDQPPSGLGQPKARNPVAIVTRHIRLSRNRGDARRGDRHRDGPAVP